MLLFGLLKLKHLLSKHNPTINTIEQEDAFEDGEYFDTAVNDFNLAFALTRITGSQKPIDRYEYIKWFARVRDETDEGRKQWLLPTYKCTDDDYAKFHPPQKRAQDRVDRLRKANGFYCIDWRNADMRLYGDKSIGRNYNQIDIMAVPCHTDPAVLQAGDPPPNYKESKRGCQLDLDKAMDYYGSIADVVVYYNEGMFKPNDFSDSRVAKQSVLHSLRINPTNPSWYPVEIQ